MKIRDRIKDLRRVKASEILPNPKNWRTHSDKQANALRSTLAEIGFADAVLCRETANGLMLIDGHLRTETAGDAIVPVLVLDVDELEADKLLATLDPLTAMAGQDTEKLAELFKTLNDAGDTLINQIWPDYVIDPLLTADWSPPEEEPLEGRGGTKGGSISLTEEQAEVWKQAFSHATKEMKSADATEGQALIWICEQWLGT